MTFYIMTHKDAVLPKASFHEAVGLGGFTSQQLKHVDSTGPGNISHLNRFYCELTGLHHVWRNTRSSLVGICHYRRYLNVVPLASESMGFLSAPMSDAVVQLLEDPRQETRAQELLRTYDVILPTAIYSPLGVGHDYKAAHGSTEWETFLAVLDEYYGPNSHGMRDERRNFYCNLMIAERRFYDHFCAHLFAVIDRVFERIGALSEMEGARYQPYRYPGYLAERFMAAFINVHRIRFYETTVISTE